MDDDSTVPPRDNRSPIARTGETAAQIVLGFAAGGLLYWAALLIVLWAETSVFDADLPFGIDVWFFPVFPLLALGAYLRYALPRFAIAWIALITGCLIVGAGFSVLLLTWSTPPD